MQHTIDLNGEESTDSREILCKNHLDSCRMPQTSPPTLDYDPMKLKAIHIVLNLVLEDMTFAYNDRPKLAGMLNGSALIIFKNIKQMVYGLYLK